MLKKNLKTLNLKFNISDDVFLKKDNYKDLVLYEKDKKNYMIMERKFTLDYSINICEDLEWNVKVLSFPTVNHDNFIVDMNGIDNFITSNSLIFNDSDIRKIILLHCDVQNKSYVRFGVAGSRPNLYHPGGEVVEIQKIDYLTNTGSSNSVSGYINSLEKEYSKIVMLSEDGKYLREERTIYSHTAWIEQKKTNTPIEIVVTSKKNDYSLLTFIYEFCQKIGLDAAGVSLIMNGDKNIKIKGRVLKSIPKKAFKDLQEATDIAIEKEFNIHESCQMQMYGTIYKRFEPEWEKFTRGRQYEKRGHYHAMILGENLDNIHNVFHVREILIDINIPVKIELYPITNVYRIYPIEYENGVYYISSSRKEAKNFADEFTNASYKL